MTNEETTMEKAIRRGPAYVDAAKNCMAWDEYTRIHSIPREGSIISVRDSDTGKVHDAIVTRIAKNGIRAEIVGMKDGLISVRIFLNGVWE